MAAVTLKEGETFDCSDTFKQVANYLPAYARPRFIRVQVLVHLCVQIFVFSFEVKLYSGKHVLFVL